MWRVSTPNPRVVQRSATTHTTHPPGQVPHSCSRPFSALSPLSLPCSLLDGSKMCLVLCLGFQYQFQVLDFATTFDLLCTPFPAPAYWSWFPRGAQHTALIWPPLQLLMRDSSSNPRILKHATLRIHLSFCLAYCPKPASFSGQDLTYSDLHHIPI